MDAGRHQTDFVTGRTLTTSASVGSYSQSQIIPYTQPRLDYGSNPPSITNNNSINNISSPSQHKYTKSKSASSWNFDESELKRRRRVASYKFFSVEGRVKLSLRKSVRWFKDKYLEMRYGWR